MRKIVSLLLFAVLSLSSWAAQSDTCKIKIVRNGSSFDVSAGSDNVYVRKGTRLDPKNYVFVTDTIVDIVCDDTLEVNLQGGHREGLVTCWSKKEGENAKQDKTSSHQLAPAKRRNWLKFNSMDASTQVEMIITDADGKTVKIDIRKCGGGKDQTVSLNYKTSGDKGDGDKSFERQGDSLTSTAIKLKTDEKLLKLILSFGKKRNMVVNNMFMDGKEISLKFYRKQADSGKQADPSDEDDIMYGMDIIADTLSLNKQLQGGNHEITYKCTELTQKGPKEIVLTVPIEVEKNNNLMGTVGIIFGVLAILGLIGFFVCKRMCKFKRPATSVKKNALMDESEKKSEIKEDKEQNGGGNAGDEENQKENAKPLGDSNEEGQNNNNPDEEIINLLKKQYNTDDKSEIIKILTNNKDTKKEGVKSVIIKWNNNHPENQLDNSQMNIDSFLNIIARGYISPQVLALLEKTCQQYDVKTNGVIDSKAINHLIEKVLNAGWEQGAASTKNTSDPAMETLREQNKKLSEDRTKIINEKEELEKKNGELQARYSKLLGDYQIIEDDNTNSILTIDKQKAQIEELQQQVDAQSKEHIVELEELIENLRKDLAAAKMTINEKTEEIAAERKNVENITKKKEDWEGKYNQIKSQLDVVDNKHKEEIDRLKDNHKEASRKQKEKYEKLLSEKNEEMSQKQEEHESALEKLKVEYEGKLTEQKNAAEAAQQELKDENIKTVEKLKKDHIANVDKLKATIKELGVSVNVSRDETINNVKKLLETISVDLGVIDNSVNATVSQTPIFVNSMKNILTELQRTSEEFDDYKNDEWKKPEKKHSEVIVDMQEIFINALSRSGWMNNVARLLSYSRLPKLYDGTADGIDLPAELEAHGIPTALLERVYANMVNLLGIANMGILIPAVLANNFDKESYEYKNGDTWIDKFFPEISTRNYKGKVFDIVQVGYTINGVTEEKPVVQYN